MLNIRCELDKLTRELVSEHELDVAQKYMEASVRRSDQLNDGAAAYVGATIIRGRPLLGLEERVELVRSITRDDVRELAGKIFGSGDFHVFTMK